MNCLILNHVSFLYKCKKSLTAKNTPSFFHFLTAVVMAFIVEGSLCLKLIVKTHHILNLKWLFVPCHCLNSI